MIITAVKQKFTFFNLCRKGYSKLLLIEQKRMFKDQIKS